MTHVATCLISLVLAQNPTDVGPGHVGNHAFVTLRRDGWQVQGQRIAFPPPVLSDSQTDAEERQALHKLAGSDRALEDLLHDGVSAPFILRTQDHQAGDAGTVRAGELWFVVRGSLDQLDPSRAVETTDAEAGNMRFQTYRVADDDLAKLRLRTVDTPESREWYSHVSAKLLGRIGVEATDRVLATRGPKSWLIASRTDTAFDADRGGRPGPNSWRPIKREGSRDVAGAAEPFPGGASYTRIGSLATVPGALLVETHFAFYEPRSWFQGAPVLRSKIGLAVQDRVRTLRRDLAKAGSKG